MKIDVGAFLDSLSIMGYGMLGIFIVTVIIISSVWFLNAVTSPKKEKENNQQ